MEKKIERIIREKEYIALSVEELVLIQDLVNNEQAFYKLKNLLYQLDEQTANVKPRTELKEKLDAVFLAKYPPKSKSRMVYLAYSSVSIAAAVLIAILWLWPTSNSGIKFNEPKNQELKSAKTVTKTLEIEDQKSLIDLNSNEMAKNQQLAKLEVIEAESSPDSINMSMSENKVAPETMSQTTHADFISSGNLKPGRKELVSENAMILNVLHTSY